ncbi:DUF3710 domain-containing protein [Brevibacterium sp. UMB10442]|nr:DUF3710 domain-containing protein [Brevibacterium sp. UMB10442]
MGLFSSFFGRKGKPEDIVDDVDAVDEVEDVDSDSEDTDVVDEEPRDSDVADNNDDDDEPQKEAPRDRVKNGPWDESEDAGQANRIDLGSLRIPVIDGMQVQLEAQEENGSILAVSLIHKGGALRVQAMAAPKTEGLWAQVRKQVSASVTAAGGTAKEVFTDTGYGLSAAIPHKIDDDHVTVQNHEYMGVDGPRWFLMGIIAQTDGVPEEVRTELVEIFRGIIVNRGDGPMPPGQVLELTPPNLQSSEDSEDSSDDDIDPFERGPEIAEVR